MNKGTRKCFQVGDKGSRRVGDIGSQKTVKVCQLTPIITYCFIRFSGSVRVEGKIYETSPQGKMTVKVSMYGLTFKPRSFVRLTTLVATPCSLWSSLAPCPIVTGCEPLQ